MYVLVKHDNMCESAHFKAEHSCRIRYEEDNRSAQNYTTVPNNIVENTL